jgi:hypothetical protein
MRTAVLLLLTLLSAACATDPFAEGDASEGARPRTNAGDTGINTDADVYDLREQWMGLGFDLEITLRNTAEQPLYIVNCNGALAPSLQKLVDGRWEVWWSGVSQLCLSQPIVIAPGDSLTRKMNIWGAMPGRNAAPAWASADVAGTYRLRLHNLVYNYTDQGQRFGDPVPAAQQFSNEFVLRR